MENNTPTRKRRRRRRRAPTSAEIESRAARLKAAQALNREIADLVIARIDEHLGPTFQKLGPDWLNVGRREVLRQVVPLLFARAARTPITT